MHRSFAALGVDVSRVILFRTFLDGFPMSLRILGFILAAALLVGYRLIKPKPRAQASDLPGPWNLSTLFLASALTLFAELALIRWVATEVRVFAYVKNLALLLCFLGFGLGCALARQRPRWQTAATALVGLIAIVRLPWRGPQVMETLSQYLGAAQDIEIWATRAAQHTSGFLLAVAVTAILLLLITYIFIPIGQTVSRQIELAPRTLYGYSWNLAGSLVGILAFFAVSWLALPPAVWFTIVLAGMALLQSNRSDTASGSPLPSCPSCFCSSILPLRTTSTFGLPTSRSKSKISIFPMANFSTPRFASTTPATRSP